MRRSEEIIFIGLSITSCWRNTHASTYRSLIRGLHRRGHKVLFLERDQLWYASNRDAAILPYCQSRLYMDVEELRARFTPRIRAAAAVIVGSSVDDGRNVCDWVLEHAGGIRAFYDMDAPTTLAKLRNDSCEYLSISQIPEFDVMLSLDGGAALQRMEREFGARHAWSLYCSVDVDQQQSAGMRRDIDLGYVGAHSADRQAALEKLLNEPARRRPKRRFAVVGAKYPSYLVWPKNVLRVDHMAPGSHTQYYARQRFTLNLKRADEHGAGCSLSVRLLEAAVSGRPILSEEWEGLGDVFEPGKEILLARSAEDITDHLDNISDEQAQRIAAAARERVCAEHSSTRRAEELESYLAAARGGTSHRERVAATPGEAVAAS